MYAIVDIQGQQFKVEKEQKVFVHRLEDKEGSKVTFDQVLLVDNDGKIDVGAPVVKGVSVNATVVSHVKGDKVKVFKKKRRKGYQKLNGHRQSFTELMIDDIASGGTAKKSETQASATKAATKSETAQETTTEKPSSTEKETKAKAAPKASAGSKTASATSKSKSTSGETKETKSTAAAKQQEETKKPVSKTKSTTKSQSTSTTTAGKKKAADETKDEKTTEKKDDNESTKSENE
ncbi:MAG: 50S ribosomal protein L21 [Bacteroidetes bacterium]|jgi:large subunit ribosomal protein L21|nr:50S ribosomal protein L21 [Bacteroidota bacterium]